MAAIRCDKCSFINEPGARFCNQCGTALEKPCPQCGASNAPGSKFCKGCGQDFVGTPSDSEQASPEPETKPLGKKVCSACRTVNEASSVYCYNCGVALPSQTVDGIEAAGNPAGFWVRAAAYIVDNVLITTFGALVLILLAGAEPSQVWGELAGYEEGWVMMLFTEALAVAYFTFAIGKWGQTVGKALLGLKVTRTDGSGVTYWRSFARYWAYYLSTIPLLLGFIVIALTSHKRGLHDYVCDTMVVKLIR